MPSNNSIIKTEFSKHLNNIEYSDTASYLLDFLKNIPSSEFDKDNVAEKYPSMLDHLPSNLDKPTFSQYLYFVNIVWLQNFVTKLNTELINWYSQISELTCKSELSADEDEKLRNLRKMSKSAYGQYIEMSNLLMKNLDSSVGREQPKKVELDVRHSVNVQQMNEFLHKSTEELKKLETDFVDGEFSIKN